MTNGQENILGERCSKLKWQFYSKKTNFNVTFCKEFTLAVQTSTDGPLNFLLPQIWYKKKHFFFLKQAFAFQLKVSGLHQNV